MPAFEPEAPVEARTASSAAVVDQECHSGVPGTSLLSIYTSAIVILLWSGASRCVTHWDTPTSQKKRPAGLSSSESLIPTGIAGLDQILHGGLTPNRVYLVEGDPGAGKTTLGLRFLIEGAAKGEQGLYVTLSETREELVDVAESHGFSLDGIEVCELVASEDALKPEAQYTIFQPSEIELGETVASVLETVERLKPLRLVFDSLSEVRLLAQNPLRYRRHILGLKQFFAGRGCTVLLLDDCTSELQDLQLHSIAHGVITLEQVAPEYGRARRRLRIMKMRGRDYVGGYHDFEIQRGGLRVFPRLVAADYRQTRDSGLLPSGVEALDKLLPGGVDRGNSTLVMGPAGAGKSALVLQYVMSAAARGEVSALFSFDESTDTAIRRAAGLGFDLQSAMASGLVKVRQIDPAEMSPGEFAALVREAVDPSEGKAASVVVIDSLNGYLQAMPEERFLVIQLHELLTYLGQLGVATFLIVAQHGLIGAGMESPVDATYLADIVILLRYFEIAGEVRRAVSVMKRRAGPHEKTIREFEITSSGIKVGPPAANLQGVLTGTPLSVAKARPGDDADPNP